MTAEQENKGGQQLTRVRELLSVNDNLSCQVFDKNNDVLPEVEEKLLEIVDFLKLEFLSSITNYQILDVVLCGSLCSYVYDEKSSLDLVVVLNNFADNVATTRHMLMHFNAALIDRGFSFRIYDHRVNCHCIVLQEFVKSICYSLVKHQWFQKPVKGSFAFTPEFCFRRCCEVSEEIHRNINVLSKVDGKFLTSQSCDILTKYLDYLYSVAMDALRLHPEHEYSLDYNLYRCLDNFGTYMHFRKLIEDSRTHLLHEVKVNGKK